MQERKKLTAVMAPEYQRARKKENGRILDQFITATRYTRRYAAHALKTHGKKVWVDSSTVIVADVRKRRDRKKERHYDGPVIAALGQVWKIMDFI